MSKKVKVTFLMTAFNGERFIRNTIASVINQSETDIRLVIRNNGSVDSTGDICKEYAKRDKRIEYIENKIGYLTDDGFVYGQREFWPILNSEYVAYIDHDDLLDRDFTSRLYKKAKENNSDITICSSAFFSDETGKVTGCRDGADFSVNDMNEVNKHFVNIYPNLRTIWGKLYRTEFFDKYYNEAFGFAFKNKIFSSDTFAVFTFLEHCESISSTSEPLYFYRVSEGSQFNSTKLDFRRIDEADILYDKAMSFLIKHNITTQKNREYLRGVHWGHMLDLLNILSKSISMSSDEKIKYIQQILKNKYLKYYLNSSFDFIYSCIYNVLSPILDSDKDNISLYRYYIVRLYNAKANNKTQHSYINILSIIKDQENINKFGFPLLSDGSLAISKGEIRFSKLDDDSKRNLLDGEYTILLEYLMYPYAREEIKKYEEELEKDLIEENYERASEVLYDLGQKYPECPSVINYRLQLLLMIGDIEIAKELVYIAKVLYKDEKEIIELCDEIISL